MVDWRKPRTVCLDAPANVQFLHSAVEFCGRNEVDNENYENKQSDIASKQHQGGLFSKKRDKHKVTWSKQKEDRFRNLKFSTTKQDKNRRLILKVSNYLKNESESEHQKDSLPEPNSAIQLVEVKDVSARESERTDHRNGSSHAIKARRNYLRALCEVQREEIRNRGLKLKKASLRREKRNRLRRTNQRKQKLSNIQTFISNHTPKGHFITSVETSEDIDNSEQNKVQSLKRPKKKKSPQNQETEAHIKKTTKKPIHRFSMQQRKPSKSSTRINDKLNLPSLSVSIPGSTDDILRITKEEIMKKVSENEAKSEARNTRTMFAFEKAKTSRKRASETLSDMSNITESEPSTVDSNVKIDTLTQRPTRPVVTKTDSGKANYLRPSSRVIITGTTRSSSYAKVNLVKQLNRCIEIGSSYALLKQSKNYEDICLSVT